jgi:hypothetical protein
LRDFVPLLQGGYFLHQTRGVVPGCYPCFALYRASDWDGVLFCRGFSG